MHRGVAQELLLWNPLLYSDLKKYIWISDIYEVHRDAQRLFDYMLKIGIYIEGFASSAKSMINLKMFHKRIYDICSLDAETSVVFCDLYFEDTDMDTSMHENRMHPIRIINPAVNGNIVIWGAGETGESVYKILQKNGKEPQYFVDSNKNLKGMIKCGLPIYMSDKLDESGQDVTVIEALEKWQELDDVLISKIKKRFHYSLNKHQWDQWNYFTCDDNGTEKKIFNLGQWWSFNLFDGKRVYIYGCGIVEYEFVTYLKLLDYDFGGFLVDESDYSRKDNYNGYPIKCVEEILYESNYFIWIYDIGKAEKLKTLGLKYFEDYVSNIYSWDITMEKRLVLDVNLGHNWLTDSKYPGIVVYGKDYTDDYKIAVLGSSTTDGAMYPFRSWPELLYEKLNMKYLTIFNCGTAGYTSGQELLRMIRDVLLLNPDMIVIYDGFNDTGIYDERYPFAFDYMRMVFDFANLHMEVPVDYMRDNWSEVCFGIESQGNLFENWFSNIQIMYAIATQKKIKFYSFFQPMLSSKKEKSEYEKNIVVSVRGMKVKKQQSFREYMSKASDIPDYIYNLSHIFDGQDDIYMDICHVWEKGNEIIAEEIKKIILPGIGASEQQEAENC